MKINENRSFNAVISCHGRAAGGGDEIWNGHHVGDLGLRGGQTVAEGLRAGSGRRPHITRAVDVAGS